MQLLIIVAQYNKALQILLFYHNSETNIIFDCLTVIPKPENRRLLGFFSIVESLAFSEVKELYDVFAELARFYSMFLGYALICMG